MIFNGLNGSDLIVYNAMLDLLEPGQGKKVSAGQVSIKTNYCPNTVRNALGRLVDIGLLKRKYTEPGHPYEYQLPTDK